VIQSRPKERKPPVKLSEDKIAGKQDLHSFGELKALFEHKKHGDSTPKDQQKKSDEPKKEGPEGEK
jgi:hypothetical protein